MIKPFGMAIFALSLAIEDVWARALWRHAQGRPHALEYALRQLEDGNISYFAKVTHRLEPILPWDLPYPHLEGNVWHRWVNLDAASWEFRVEKQDLGWVSIEVHGAYHGQGVASARLLVNASGRYVSSPWSLGEWEGPAWPLDAMATRIGQAVNRLRIVGGGFLEPLSTGIYMIAWEVDKLRSKTRPPQEVEA